MKTIELSKRGKYKGLYFALVDDSDFDYLNEYNWSVMLPYKSKYAGTFNNNKMILMHRLIMDAPNVLEVDHIDHNGLNNQKSNLRICLHWQNISNRSMQYNNTLGFKGVSFDKNRKKWVVQIQSRGTKYIKRFDDKYDAARHYDLKIGELCGEFANINFKLRK